jgi:peptidoglycan/xylan/chitin deacetylase (PgdA/CDA1 family)
MTVQEIVEIAKLPQVTIGGHGIHHLLTTHGSEDELITELSESKAMLENWIKQPVKYFAYPKGAYNSRAKSILEEYGYEMAAGTENNLVTDQSDLYAVPRFGVRSDSYLAEGICQAVGVWYQFRDSFIFRLIKKTLSPAIK